MSTWFVYVDYTDDGRPFYVGKGTAARVKKRERNSDWVEIAAEHGQRREVVFGTRDESSAYELEEQLVREYGTYDRWGANLRPGGYGRRSGWRHTRATRERLRQLATGVPSPKKGKPAPSPPNKGVPMSEEQKRRLSELNKGKPSNRLGAKHTEESRKKMSEAHKGQPAWNKRFTDEIVDEMLKDRESGMMISDIAARYETSAPTVCRLFRVRKEKNGEA